MSKKTRKKTLEKSPKKPVAKASAAKSATATRTAAAKKRSKTADKPSPNVSKKTKTAAKPAVKATAKKTTSKASQQDQSKPLKSKPAVAKAAKPKAAIAVKPMASASSHSGSPVAAAGGQAALAEGMKAPAFQLPRDGGQSVSLSDFVGGKLVLFFYPRADTPGCTKEAIDFTRLAADFAESHTAVLGVSADPLKAQEAFRDKHELAVPLASDEQHEMLEAYGAWGEKSMYGRTFLGVVRTTVLIGMDGRIVKIWRHVKVDGHADEVLATARAA